MEIYKKYLVSENIHKDIKKLLDNGKKVRSAASGRVGPITKVDGNDVIITIKGSDGVTSFLVGDKVKLIKQDGTYVVVNN